MSSPTQETRERSEIELRINRLKREMDDALSRYYSDERRDEAKLWELREELAEISLRNCREIVSYVRKVSAPVANDLEMRRLSVMRKLRGVKKTHDLELLRRWQKDELAPLLNRTEQAGYLVAVAARKPSADEQEKEKKNKEKRGAPTFTWQLQEPPGGEEHIKRFGKTADEFQYLDQTCPVCGNRIDERGWCGCGTIGGG